MLLIPLLLICQLGVPTVGPLPPKLMHELSFRFALRPDTRPGLHPWPLLLSVRPLY